MLLTDFSQWLRDELAKKGLVQADIARRAGLSPSQVSRIINARSAPSQDALASIARSLRLPPEEVFRRAGLLPPIPGEDTEITELDHIARQLDETNKNDLVRYARLRLQIQEEKGEYHVQRTRPSDEISKS
jgi:transcriptional regulator with XRE-family HTH domain